MRSSVCVVGDLSLAGGDLQAATKTEGWSLWTHLRLAVGASTALIANLECALTDRAAGRPLKYANLRAPSELAQCLRNLDLAVIGNNHVTDFGPGGVKDTVKALADEGVSSVGYGETLFEALRPSFLTVGSRRLGVVSLCCPTTNGEALATHTTAGVALLGMATLEQAIRGAREDCDALLVYLHWGKENVHDPVPDQLRLARHAVDLGADAVVGCHSHTVQSYECYRGRWIFYGLGNFLFGDVETQEVDGDGLVRPGLRVQAPSNRESLVLQFALGNPSTQSPLELTQIHFFQYDREYVPTKVAEDQLTFDLGEANRRLVKFAAERAEWLRTRREPAYRSEVRNGTLAHFYCEAPIGQDGSGGYLRLLRTTLRGALVRVINVTRIR
jgi:hypothetical protein